MQDCSRQTQRRNCSVPRRRNNYIKWVLRFRTLSCEMVLNGSGQDGDQWQDLVNTVVLWFPKFAGDQFPGDPWIYFCNSYF